MSGSFDDIIRAILGMPAANREDVFTQQVHPNILGPEYDNLPQQKGTGVLGTMFPGSSPNNYMPSIRDPSMTYEETKKREKGTSK